MYSGVVSTFIILNMSSNIATLLLSYLYLDRTVATYLAHFCWYVRVIGGRRVNLHMVCIGFFKCTRYLFTYCWLSRWTHYINVTNTENMFCGKLRLNVYHNPNKHDTSYKQSILYSLIVWHCFFVIINHLLRIRVSEQRLVHLGNLYLTNFADLNCF